MDETIWLSAHFMRTISPLLALQAINLFGIALAVEQEEIG
jgi:hypothetical protein